MIGRNLDLTGTLHSMKLKAFGENFLESTLKPFYKSDPIPETNDMNVKVVAGNNFDEIVLNESKDVLLEPYQLWNYGEYKYESLETSEDPIGLQRSSELLITCAFDKKKTEHMPGDMLPHKVNLVADT